MNAPYKSLLALLLGAGLLLTAALAQDTNIVVNTPATGLDATGIDLNLFTAMGSQFLKTPANLLLILAVSVIAWLWEITPAVNSRYVPHLCVLCATVGYPFLADRSAIPKSYPHPLMVMILSGIIVGAISAAVHKPLMKKLGILPAVVPLLLLSLGLALGCAGRLQPGADPFVVAVERVQTVAEPGFDLVLNVDHANRGFWRTNAPAFHNFAQLLRERVAVTNVPDRTTLPRYVAAQWQVDQLKQQYKAAKSAANSNALASALIALQALSDQTAAWLTIVTNAPGR